MRQSKKQHSPISDLPPSPRLFSRLASAYFTPSTSHHLPHLFRLHGGKTLPRDPNDESTDPLSLPVSYFFVNGPQDAYIKYLTGRPVVLYDAAWVMECVLAVKVLGLTRYVVDVANWGMASISSSSSGSSGSSPIMTSMTPSVPISPTSNRDIKHQAQPIKPQAARAKYLVDFNTHTSLDILSGKISNFKIPLKCTKPLDQPVKAESSVRQYTKSLLRQSDFPMLNPPSNANPTISGKRKRKSPEVYSTSTPTNKRVKSDVIPIYSFSEVMELLSEEVKEEAELEVVAGDMWRSEIPRRTKRVVG